MSDRNKMLLVNKRRRQFQSAKSTIDGLGNKVKNGLVSFYNKMVRTNYFYLVYFILLSCSLFFLYKVKIPNANGLQGIWIILAFLTTFLLFRLYKDRRVLGIHNKFDGMWANIIVTVVFCPAFAYFIKAPIMLMLMPLLIVIPYYDDEIKKSRMAIGKYYFTTLAIMGLFTIVISPYAVGILEMKSNILSAFYSASIAVYAIILTIVGTFLSTSIRSIQRLNIEKQDFRFDVAIIGLIRMCMVFILITLLAFLTGMYTSDTNPTNLTASPFGFVDSLVKFYPIFMLGLVVVSFPVVFTYMYFLIENYISHARRSSK